MISEWDVPFLISDSEGTLPLNTLTSFSFGTGLYLINRPGSSVTRPIRATVTPIPQGFGSIFGERFLPEVQLNLQLALLQDTDTPACGELLVDMYDHLGLHLNALLNAGTLLNPTSGRIQWTPTGKSSDRALDNIRWRNERVLTFEGEAVPLVTFTLDCPFPYAIDLAQTTPSLNGTITNNGNENFYPVVRVNGPTSGTWGIFNETTGLFLFYDDTRPGAVPIGAGDYAEIDMFRNTIYLNGDGANLKAGVDAILSDFFWFQPGANVVSANNCSGVYLVNDAYGA